MKGFILSAVCLFAMLGCGGSDSSSNPTSAEGKWTYTTPDSKINITFDLVKLSSGSLDIQNPTIKINGTSYIAAAAMSGVALPAISSIMVNANDSSTPQGHSYLVSLAVGQVSSDFKKITFSTGTYEYPASQINNLTNAAVTRP